MEGLTGSELAMIKRLAGNDTDVRKKSMKKLKKWLTAISMKVPDSPDCRELIENNFLRVWKALFYCMWHADKPLPQEQLAEQISSMVRIFASKPNVMNLFIEWFFRTMAREWSYIDRFRIDKFMMLIRRFLRSTLMVLSERKWKLDVLDGFLRIITVILFNHHPEIKNTRSKARDPEIEKTPLGLQIHITDVFLEELAKIGVGTLKSQKILKILGPFIRELCTNDDDRILNVIKERIFFHLMRQSDAGIDYAEGCLYGGGEDELGNEDEDEKDDNDDEDNDGESGESEGGAEDEELLLSSGPLDPRAGGVDAILPQLDIDYKELSDKLIEAGGQKTVKGKNRKIVYSLARKFQEISAGDYPLAIEIDDDRKPAIQHKDVKAATQRLLKMEEGFSNPDRKKRLPKKVRKRLAKAKEQMEAAAAAGSNDSIGSESDNQNSIYLDDDELLDHVSDNYMSYLEELHQKEQKEGKENERAASDEEDADGVEVGFSDDEDEVDHLNGNGIVSNSEGDEAKETLEPAVIAKAKLNKNNKKTKVMVKGKKLVQTDTVKTQIPTPTLVDSSTSPNKKKNKRNNKYGKEIPTKESEQQTEVKTPSPTPTLATILNDSNGENSLINNNFAGMETSTPINATAKKLKRRSLNLTRVVGTDAVAEDFNGEKETYVLLSSEKKKPKKRKMSEVMSLGLDSATTPVALKTPLSAKRKRVSFVLARNSQHEHSDYAQSINRSPAIPYDAGKQPGSGLLKSPKSFVAASAGSHSRQCSPLVKNGFLSRRKSGLF